MSTTASHEQQTTSTATRVWAVVAAIGFGLLYPYAGTLVAGLLAVFIKRPKGLRIALAAIAVAWLVFGLLFLPVSFRGAGGGSTG